MLRAVPAGMVCGVSFDTTITVRKASGIVQAAGWTTRARAQPAGGAPITFTRAAALAATPPTISPAAAPVVDMRRHQMPSTSIGQKVEAATANASPTVSARLRAPVTRKATYGTDIARSAAMRKLLTAR